MSGARGDTWLRTVSLRRVFGAQLSISGAPGGTRGYSGVLGGTHLSRVVVLRVLKLGSRVAIEYTPAWYAETEYLSAAACSARVCVCV